MRKPVLVLVAATALLVVLMSSGAMARAKIDSSVDIDWSEMASFHGNVNSSNVECVTGRKVLLQRKRLAGQSRWKTMGSDFADGGGLWNVDHDPKSGFAYTAKIKPKEVSAGTCRGDRSKQMAFI